MKKAVLTTLFAGLVLFSAGAQNTNRIVEEESDVKVTTDMVWNVATERKGHLRYNFLPPPSLGTK